MRKKQGLIALADESRVGGYFGKVSEIRSAVFCLVPGQCQGIFRFICISNDTRVSQK